MKKLIVLLGIAALSLSAFAVNPGYGTTTASCDAGVSLTVERTCGIGFTNDAGTVLLADPASVPALALNMTSGQTTDSKSIYFRAGGNYAWTVAVPTITAPFLTGTTRIPSTDATFTATINDLNTALLCPSPNPTQGVTLNGATLVQYGTLGKLTVIFTAKTILPAGTYEGGSVTLTIN